jgi:hypothetical protein
MTTINFLFAAVDNFPTDGTITARAPRLRPGGTAAITGEPRSTALIDGAATMDLDPGEVVLVIAGDGASHTVEAVVPDEESIEFLDLLEDNFDWAPEVVLAAQAAARDARASAQIAAESAAIVGSAQRVLQAEAAAAQSVLDADAAAQRSATSATESAGSATLAGEHRDATQEILDDTLSAGAAAADRASAAATSASDAASSARDAAESETTADSRATAAKTYMDTAWKNRSEAIAAKTEAVDAQTGAEEARGIAQGHAASAADSCSQAQDAATNAASDVRTELNSIKADAQSAATASATSATASADSAEQARLSAESAAEVVASGVPDATPTIKGKMKLAGDLAGTADAPRVPGLADKADTVHTHQIGDVSGLQDTVDDVTSATYQATAGRIMRRGADGTTSVATPTGSTHAATKGYVDNQVSGAVADKASRSDIDALRDVVLHRPSTFSGDGPPPETIPGAVVGDFWLDESTMELHKITEV